MAILLSCCVNVLLFACILWQHWHHIRVLKKLEKYHYDMIRNVAVLLPENLKQRLIDVVNKEYVRD